MKHDPRITPFFIPFRDRISYLRCLVEWLLDRVEPSSIHIIDMGSTYPEAVSQLHEWKWKGLDVVFFGSNVGAWGLFREDIVEKSIGRRTRFLVSDPDVVPSDNCDSNLIGHLHELLDFYPPLAKVGLGLKIDDLPDHFGHKDHVLRHEKRYWKKTYRYGGKDAEELFAAPIATTFVMYRSLVFTNGDGDPSPGMECARTKPPNLGIHLPWYSDLEHLSPDEKYYFDHCPWRDRPKIPGSSWKPGMPSPP